VFHYQDGDGLSRLPDSKHGAAGRLVTLSATVAVTSGDRSGRATTDGSRTQSNYEVIRCVPEFLVMTTFEVAAEKPHWLGV
jgi:hypothetical protein